MIDVADMDAEEFWDILQNYEPPEPPKPFPTNPSHGDLFYDTDEGKSYCWIGERWIKVSW